MSIKLSDWIMQRLVREGVEHVFLVTGGGAMHLNDSVGHTPGLSYVCTLHEQAAAMAAESYTKASDRLGVCLVTTGPGGTNALTGVTGAWLDSTPMLVLSGQVKRADLKCDSGVRQLGVQEVDVVSMAAPVTKYAVTVLDPNMIRYHVEKALWLARSGRPGPVWLDIPLDVQGAIIDEATLVGFDPDQEAAHAAAADTLREAAQQTLAALSRAERPVVFVGNGVRLAGGRSVLRQLIDRLGIPVLTTWPAQDLVPDDHPLMMGRPGPVAPRGANFTIQNADFVLALGARLDLVVTGYAPQHFARAAYKVFVDIDRAEADRIAPHVARTVVADAKAFIEALLAEQPRALKASVQPWIERCERWRDRWPVVLPEFRNRQDGVSTYVLAEAIGKASRPDDVIVSGSSGAGIEVFLMALKLREGQRCFLTTALGAMGNGLPATIGAALATGRRIISVDGDGGFQLNVQELETLRRLQLNVKIFVLNNDGYASIRTSQSRYFGRLAGADHTSGVTLPSLEKVCDAYGVPHTSLRSDLDIESAVRDILDRPGPLVCEVLTPADEPRMPSMASAKRADGSMVSRPLEDLWPFLPRAEFESEMIIEPLPE